MEHRFAREYRELGKRYRALRLKRGMVQEDVLDYGFSVRHYQQLEAGRPHSLTSLFRVAEMFKANPAALISRCSGRAGKRRVADR